MLSSSYYVSPANSSELMYDYKLNRVAATEFKYEEPQYAGLETDTVTIFNRHGVRIVIKQTGTSVVQAFVPTR